MTREELNHQKQNVIDEAFTREQRKKFVITMLKAIIIVLILFVVFYFYNNNISTGGIILKEKRIINEKIPDNMNGLKIIQFSDLKYGTTMNINKVKELVNLINSRKPDLVLFTGNLISDKYELSAKEQESLIKILSKIDSRLGNYAIYGYDDDESFRTILNQSDFNIMANGYDLIYKNNSDPILLIGED